MTGKDMQTHYGVKVSTVSRTSCRHVRLPRLQGQRQLSYRLHPVQSAGTIEERGVADGVYRDKYSCTITGPQP